MTDTDTHETTDINRIAETQKIIVLSGAIEIQRITEIPGVQRTAGNFGNNTSTLNILASFLITKNMSGAAASTTSTQPNLNVLH